MAEMEHPRLGRNAIVTLTYVGWALIQVEYLNSSGNQEGSPIERQYQFLFELPTL